MENIKISDKFQKDVVLSALGDSFSDIFLVNLEEGSFDIIKSVATNLVFDKNSSYIDKVTYLLKRINVFDYLEAQKYLLEENIKKNYSKNKLSLYLCNNKRKDSFILLEVRPIATNKIGELNSFLICFSNATNVIEQISDFRNDSLGKLVDSQKLVQHMFDKYNLNMPIDVFIDYVLTQFGKFFGSEKTYFLKKNNGILKCQNEWDNGSYTRLSNIFNNLKCTDLYFCRENFEDKEAFYIKDIEIIKNTDKNLYKLFAKHNIKSIALAPVMINSNVYGIVGIENPKVQEIDNLEMVLLTICNRLSAVLTNEETQKIINFDQITRLPNINQFSIFFEKTIYAPPKYSYAVIKIDIQRFKLINSFYGYQYGNKLLTALAEFLTKNATKALMISRLPNSDNFYLLVDEDKNSIESTAKNLLREFKNQNDSLYFGLVFGAYVLKDSHEKYNDCIAKVTLAHSLAREDLLHPFRFYNDELEEESIFEQEVLNSFETAIENEEFVVYIQPKYDMVQKVFYGGEALVRWFKNGVLIPPNRFIPVLENNGLITTLDHYVLVKVLKAIRESLDNNEETVPVAVNLSRIDFYDTKLIKDIVSIIDSFNIPHEYILIEITESAFIETEDIINKFINDCKKESIVVVMDDFGSGSSSLNSLKNLDVSAIKMDYKFLSNTKNVQKRNAIIETIISFARKLEVPIVVEGVEKEKDATFLRQLGVRFIQGYLYAKPMPIKEFQALSKKYNRCIEESYERSSLEEIFNNNSTLNKMFNDAISYNGIFEYANGFLSLALQNLTMERAARSLNLMNKDYHNKNFLDYVAPEDKSEFINYLEEKAQKLSKNNVLNIRMKVGENYYPLRAKATFIETRFGTSVFLLQFIKNLIGENHPQLDKGFYLSDYGNILDKLKGSYIIIDKQNKLIYCNETFEKLYSLRTGDLCCKRSCEDCKSGQCPLKEHNNSSRFYVKSMRKYIEIFSQEILVNGQKCTLVQIISQEDNEIINNSQILRINKSITDLLNAYVEVDLDTLECEVIKYGNSCLLNSNDHISYDEFYNNVLNGNIILTSKKIVSERLNKKVFTEFINSKKRSYSFIVKHGDKEYWEKIVIEVVNENGKRYASISFRNATNDVLKDLDSLTKLLTRNSGKIQINNYINYGLVKKASFVMFDVDKFKEINDTYGHLVGDKVLVAITKRIFSLQKDYLAYGTRLGGDEFGFLLVNYDDVSFERIISDFIESIKTVNLDADIEEPVEISLGFSFYPNDGLTFNSLYAKADKYMYIAKNKKKNRL